MAIKQFDEPTPLSELSDEMRRAGGSIVVAGRRVTGEKMLGEWHGHLGWSGDSEPTPKGESIDDEYSQMNSKQLNAVIQDLGVDVKITASNAVKAQAIRDHLNK